MKFDFQNIPEPTAYRGCSFLPEDAFLKRISLLLKQRRPVYGETSLWLEVFPDKILITTETQVPDNRKPGKLVSKRVSAGIEATEYNIEALVLFCKKVLESVRTAG